MRTRRDVIFLFSLSLSLSVVEKIANVEGMSGHDNVMVSFVSVKNEFRKKKIGILEQYRDTPQSLLYYRGTYKEHIVIFYYIVFCTCSRVHGITPDRIQSRNPISGPVQYHLIHYDPVP